MNETVLIVDDEDSVRRTFQEWLASSGLGITVFASPDAESALRIVNEHPIDLAVLDWNLGSGSDGLRLLEDIVEFQPDVVAILVTGFAGIATPLQALRMGVRDYLDKNADLNRETFLKAIRNQLDRIRPARHARALNRAATEFRAAVENVLPLVRTTAAFNDPVPLPEAVRALLRFLIRATGATDGALLVRHLAPDGTETTAAYSPTGETHSATAIPFAQSLAASIVSHQEPMVVNGAEAVTDGAVQLMPFELGRKSILAAPLPVGGGTSVVLELFDKPAPGFTQADRQLMAPAMEIGADLLRQSFAERQTSRLLFDAVDAALKASTGVTDVLSPAENPLPAAMERLKAGLAEDTNATADPETTLRLVEAVRSIAVRHGPTAVEHCVRMVTDLRKLLDELTGT
ncbi:MAG: transcriptional regulator [Planctomycetaceae bacterium]|nr:transcriptional regulator [Planctomycetaceae bacterium]